MRTPASSDHGANCPPSQDQRENKPHEAGHRSKPQYPQYDHDRAAVLSRKRIVMKAQQDQLPNW